MFSKDSSRSMKPSKEQLTT